MPHANRSGPLTALKSTMRLFVRDLVVDKTIVDEGDELVVKAVPVHIEEEPVAAAAVGVAAEGAEEGAEGAAPGRRWCRTRCRRQAGRCRRTKPERRLRRAPHRKVQALPRRRAKVEEGLAPRPSRRAVERKSSGLHRGTDIARALEAAQLDSHRARPAGASSNARRKRSEWLRKRSTRSQRPVRSPGTASRWTARATASAPRLTPRHGHEAETSGGEACS